MKPQGNDSDLVHDYDEIVLVRCKEVQWNITIIKTMSKPQQLPSSNKNVSRTWMRLLERSPYRRLYDSNLLIMLATSGSFRCRNEASLGINKLMGLRHKGHLHGCSADP